MRAAMRQFSVGSFQFLDNVWTNRFLQHNHLALTSIHPSRLLAISTTDDCNPGLLRESELCAFIGEPRMCSQAFPHAHLWHSDGKASGAGANSTAKVSKCST